LNSTFLNTITKVERIGRGFHY